MVKRVGIAALLLAISLLICWFVYSKNSSNDKKSTITNQGQKEQQDAFVDQNLKNSIEVFLTQWQKDKEVNLIMPSADKGGIKSGYYVYSVTLSKADKLVILTGSNFDFRLPIGKVAMYEQFSNVSTDLSTKSTALAIVQFKENTAISASAYQLKSSLGVLTKTLAASSFKEGTATEGQTTEQIARSYKELSADQWRGMTLLTAREIKKKNMAPVISVPNKNVNSKDYLIGTYYYIIGGVVKSGNDKETVLTVQGEKDITLDFAIPSVSKYVGQPVWLHIVTHKGEIQNIEVQAFEGADANAMLAGMNSYIQIANLE